MDATADRIDHYFGPYRSKFWSLVHRDGSNDCWEWRGRLNDAGYGVMECWRDGKRVVLRAHRIAMHLNGMVAADGQIADHLCRNRSCVNPAHLEFVTYRENTVRGNVTNISSLCRKKLHLMEGHNIRWRRGGGRRCRACETMTTGARHVAS